MDSDYSMEAIRQSVNNLVGLTEDEIKALRNMPEELIQWFAGHGVLADRYGMRRFEIRHRVVEIDTILGSNDEPYIVDASTREFKTYKAAVAHRDNLTAQGAAVLLQHGVLVWTTAEEDRKRDGL
jgi:hypothetical protein